MQIDDDVGERLDATPFGAENENGLTVIDEPPGGREAEFTLVVGKKPGASTLRRNPGRRRGAPQETLDPRPLVADPEIKSCVRGGPHHLAEAHAGRPPVILDDPARVISAKPSGKVFELFTVGQDGREADNPAFMGVRTAQKPLNLNLVTNLAFVEADHVPFVKDQ